MSAAPDRMTADDEGLILDAIDKWLVQKIIPVAMARAAELAFEAMRIHGAYGYSKEYPIERLYRDAPLTCIGEGTNEMQRIIIAKQLVKRNPV
ncbi:MAG: alkylation response protein AidB-like acyl-CoA dehydrogenase [Gammaproteobacteria bacterium]|jgi:alkylation response protein AidB-like acyl-CoA dehydrogenase